MIPPGGIIFHCQAIAMAGPAESHTSSQKVKTRKSTGTYGPATKLANDITTAQAAEITPMNKILGK
ncbi:hypothetical protein [Streptomyces sp. 35G-GA-8]|uniref:hypothetical protein n=1 Tax=Streptomyces sp. 35G-GA-8 TaxID=2939434 RepID=UPI0027E4759C|nr:hypothetical protein [Streptomyces sp. 35G-GA-8]